MKKDNALVRESNVELLRIISMSLIFLNHLAYHGGFFDNATGINKHIANLFVCGGKFGVAIFVLIGAYFLTGKPFRFKSVLNIWIKTFIVSVLAGLALFIKSGIVKDLLKAALPLYTAVLWFVPVYIALLFLSPFLNKLIISISRRNLFCLIAILAVPLSIIPVLKNGNDVFLGSGNLLWFIFLYLIAAYIRLYVGKEIARFKLLFVLTFVATYLLMFVLVDRLGEDGLIFRSNGSILLLISAIEIFLLFTKCVGVFHNGIINSFGKASFVVYLLHDNLARNVLWHDVLKTEILFNSDYFIVYAFGLLILFFVGALIINDCLEYMCQLAFKNYTVGKVCNRIDSAINMK